ncbi:MAG: hypothetical protein GEU77_01240 [Deltaproteobacteria bacterium]|nr:hypothetical protein [Deltaproteobacteria bacterium]
MLIGTRHDYQRPGNLGSEEFRALVAATSRDQDIKAIGEEMNLDTLNLHGAKQSICEQVAHSLRIQHHYCDPSIEEQKKLGIKGAGKSSPADFFLLPSKSFWQLLSLTTRVIAELQITTVGFRRRSKISAP